MIGWIAPTTGDGLTTSFDRYGSSVLTSISNSDDEEEQSERQIAAILSQLQRTWNLLDLADFAPIFQGDRNRKIYLKDLTEVRHGGAAYYSLGGDERKNFGTTFLTLSRRVQESFLQCATACLHQNRFMTQADMTLIIQEGRGKRHRYEFHRSNKRQRTTNHVQCFA